MDLRSSAVSPWRMAISGARACGRAEGDQPETENEGRDHHVICLGKPGGEAERAKQHNEQLGCATYRRDHRSNDTGGDQSMVAHRFQLLGADG